MFVLQTLFAICFRPCSFKNGPSNIDHPRQNLVCSEPNDKYLLFHHLTKNLADLGGSTCQLSQRKNPPSEGAHGSIAWCCFLRVASPHQRSTTQEGRCLFARLHSFASVSLRFTSRFGSRSKKTFSKHGPVFAK